MNAVVLIIKLGEMIMSNTAVIEGRIDVRDLATCADYFMKQGMTAMNKSSLLRQVVTVFADAAASQGAKAFETTEEALGFLFNIGLGPVNRVIDNRGKRAGSFTLAQTIRTERGSEVFADLAREAVRRMDSNNDSSFRDLGVDSEVDPAIRAQRAAEEDDKQKARMDEFVKSLNVAKSASDSEDKVQNDVQNGEDNVKGGDGT